jgi:hypothetical protein
VEPNTVDLEKASLRRMVSLCPPARARAKSAAPPSAAAVTAAPIATPARRFDAPVERERETVGLRMIVHQGSEF